MNEALLLEWIKCINDAVTILSGATPGGLYARGPVRDATTVAVKLIADFDGEKKDA